MPGNTKLSALNLARLSHRHEGVINWMLANPHKRVSDCAKALGYSKVWVSMLTQNDMFKTELRRRAESAGIILAIDTQEKIAGLLDLTLEKTAEILEKPGATDTRFLGETMKNLLNASGYGAKAAPPQPQQHLHFHTSLGQDIADARDRANQALRGTAPAKVGDMGAGQVIEASAVDEDSPLLSLDELFLAGSKGGA